MNGKKDKKLAAVYAGSSQHFRSLNEPKYRKHFEDIIYLPDLPFADLTRFDGLLIPSRTNRNVLAKAKENIAEFLNSGKTVIAFGEQPHPILPNVIWEYRPTNFWWWLEPGAQSSIVAVEPNHELFRYIMLRDATWHYHGIFRPPEGSDVVLGVVDDSVEKRSKAPSLLPIFYIDRISTRGTMVITSLDPMFHFGSYFMPQTERFLDGFLSYVSQRLL